MWSNRSFRHIIDLESKTSKIYKNGSLNTTITVSELIPIIIAYSIEEIKYSTFFHSFQKKKVYCAKKW